MALLHNYVHVMTRMMQTHAIAVSSQRLNARARPSARIPRALERATAPLSSARSFPWRRAAEGGLMAT